MFCTLSFQLASYVFLLLLCLCVIIMYVLFFRRGADKSVARSGRKQATATKLGIYSSYSPRSSIHYLARCNFSTPLKQIQNIVRPTRFCGSNNRVGRKWRPLIVFAVQGTCGSRTEPDRENRLGDQDTGSPGRPVSSGL